MSTPPRITHSELLGHLRLIVSRRVKVDDPHVELLPAVDNGLGRREVCDVLAYLRKYPTEHRWVQQADAVAALELTVWLWWEDRRDELHWLKTGRARGLFLSQIGAPLGISTRRGVLDRIDRLEALLRYDRPDEQITREARRLAAGRDANRDVEMAWVREHQGELRDVAAGLLDAARRYEVNDREMLDELADDAGLPTGLIECEVERPPKFTPASLAILGLAAAEVATAPRVAELADRPQPYKVHRVLEKAAALRAVFADLGMADYRASARKKQR